MENVFATPLMMVDGITITAESHPHAYENALDHFEYYLRRAEQKVKHLNRLIDFLEEGNFEFGRNLFGRTRYWGDDFHNERPEIKEDYGYSFIVRHPDGDVKVEYNAFPMIWGSTEMGQLSLNMLGVELDKDALGTYCAKAKLFKVDFKFNYSSWRGGSCYEYDKVVSEPLNGHERAMKASTMYKKLIENTSEVRIKIESKNLRESVIERTIAKYKELYPMALVQSVGLMTRNRGRMVEIGQGIRIDFPNGSYIEMSVTSKFGEERMHKYLDKRVNTLELSDLCDHLSK